MRAGARACVFVPLEGQGAGGLCPGDHRMNRGEQVAHVGVCVFVYVSLCWDVRVRVCWFLGVSAPWDGQDAGRSRPGDAGVKVRGWRVDADPRMF